MIKYIKKYELYFIAVLCTLLWGSAIPIIKLGYAMFGIDASSSADKIMFAGVCFFGAGLIILIPYFILTKKLSVSRRLIGSSLFLGTVQTAGQYFFMYIGLAYTTSVNTSVFNALGTLLYIVLAFLIFKSERLTKYKVLGTLIGFAGIILNSIATQRMGLFTLNGDGFIIIANVCVAVGFLYSKHSVINSDPFLLTGLQMSIGGGILLTIGLISGGRLPTVTVGGIALLLYLMAVSSVGFSLWTLLLKKYSPALVGMFNFLTPVFGSLFSYLFSALGYLDEASSFTVYTLIAIIGSAGGIFLASLKRS